MTAPDRDRLRLQLIRDEGLRLKPYKCTAGQLTIGVGRNLADNGITEREAMFLLDNDIESALTDLTVRYQSWFPQLDPVRQAVVANMAFNLGFPRFTRFVKTIDLIRRKDYEGAAIEMLVSPWAEQVGDRSLRLAEQMRTGRWVD